MFLYTNKMRTPNAFKEYAEMRQRNPQNKGKSFTYGCILYDYIKNGGNFAELWYNIEQQALEIVQTQLDAKRDAVYNLSDLALAEILDISILDELATPLFD